MRALRVAAALVLPLFMLFALEAPGHGSFAWAQLPTPNPLVGPRPLPSPPPTLPAPVPPQGIPSLVPVLPPPTPTPAPQARVFNCACFGPSSGTHWMGHVQAPTYFAARQSALGACLAYSQREPQSPLILPRISGLTPPIALPPGFAPTDEANEQEQPLPGTLNFSTAQQLRMCSQCTCD